MQAVIKIANSQYIVSPQQQLEVDKVFTSTGKQTLSEVLLLIDGDKVVVGQPHVAGASVDIEVLGTVKGEKVRVFKFKAKSRYRKTKGFRPQYSQIKVLDIREK